MPRSPSPRGGRGKREGCAARGAADVVSGSQGGCPGLWGLSWDPPRLLMCSLCLDGPCQPLRPNPYGSPLPKPPPGGGLLSQGATLLVSWQAVLFHSVAIHSGKVLSLTFPVLPGLVLTSMQMTEFLMCVSKFWFLAWDTWLPICWVQPSIDSLLFAQTSAHPEQNYVFFFWVLTPETFGWVWLFSRGLRLELGRRQAITCFCLFT